MDAHSVPWHDAAQLQWLEQRGPLQLAWTPDLHAAACEAAQEGNIAVLRTLLARSGFHLATHCDGELSGKMHYCSNLTSRGSPYCHCRQYGGRLESKDTRLVCRQVLDFCHGTLRIYKAAASSGQVPVLAWLFAEVHPFPWHEIEARTQGKSRLARRNLGLVMGLLAAAAASEELQVLAWLHAEMPSDMWRRSLFAAFEAAAKANSLPVVVWLHDHSDPEDWTAKFSTAAAEAGHVNILRWLCIECLPPCPVDKTTLAFAASSGQVESLQLLRSLKPPCPWSSDAVSMAIRENNAETMAWLLEHGAPHPGLQQLEDAFCEYGMGPFGRTLGPTICLILSAHQVLMPEKQMLDARLDMACWCTFMGLVRWAQRMDPVQLGSDALQGVAAHHRAQHVPPGLLLLTQIACLPDELVRHIGAAAGIHYHKGGKVFRHIEADDLCSDVITDVDF